MPQRHLDPLSAVDAAFLHQEDDTAHMHIGAAVVLDGPAPAIEDFREHIRGRLPLVPRYRQKLATPPLSLGRPRWVDDPRFRLDYHVRHTALPAPGDDLVLKRLIGRLFAQRLDRTKPLWELWVVEGLDGGRWALISKTHHALVDGVAGVDLMTMLFDSSPQPRAIDEPDNWVPRPDPTDNQLAAAALNSAAHTAASVPLRIASSMATPARAAAELREAIGGLSEVVRAGLTSPPNSPLNVPIGPHRRFDFVRASLDDFKAVKDAFGGTVNDVVLTVVAGGLAAFTAGRGAPTEDVVLRAAVPVSTRSSSDRGAMGNRITQLVAPLPLSIGDPVARLQTITREMDGIKDSRQALGAEVIAGAQGLAPPTILAQASRLNFSTRFYNLLVTNIPGPQMPLYVLGRRMRDLFPVPFLAGDRALAVALMSYDGEVGFGLLGDLDALPDLKVIARGIEQSLAELVTLARGEVPGDQALGLDPSPRRRPAKRARS